jgi:carbon storage regulator
MLVLSRKCGEIIQIANDIKITVVEVRGNRVKIGIEAPTSYSIVRGELEEHPAAIEHRWVHCEVG